MAVLVEAISVVILRAQIETRYPGGWGGFVADCPNNTLCADADLARVGFMTPVDVQWFCGRLEECGLTYLHDGRAVDLAVVDQLRGPTAECAWLEFGHTSLDGHRIAACRIVGSSEDQVFTPDGWRYEKSLSSTYVFIPGDAVDKSLRFLRHENGVDVFLNRLTGKEVYQGRTSETPSDKEVLDD